MNPLLDATRSTVFEHPAMNTAFAIRLPQSIPAKDAAPVVGACFNEIDRLESLLSRYIEDSDVSRINALEAGQSLLIHDDTHALLLEALELHTLTGGLFDVTLGRQTLHRQLHRGEDAPPPPPLHGGFAVDPQRPRVTCIEPGRHIDLGGIGKGFALDRAASLLAEHGIGDALLQAGSSTLLACGRHPWRVTIDAEPDPLEIPLRAAALSTSGTGIQGIHVLSPDGSLPNSHAWARVRVMAARASTADALSTACLLMDEPQLRAFAAATPGVLGLWTGSWCFSGP